MKKNNLQQIWQSGVDDRINLLPEAELKALTVKSARKAIRQLYPGWILIALCIIFICYFAWKIITQPDDVRLVVYHISVSLIISGCLIWMLISFLKMNRYNDSLPLKDWVESRIKWIEKNIDFTRKYGLYFSIGGGLLGLGIGLTYNYLLGGRLVLPVFIPMVIAIALTMAFSNMMTKKRNLKALARLRELYDEIVQGLDQHEKYEQS